MAIKDDLTRMQSELIQWDQEIVRLGYDAETEAKRAYDTVKAEYTKRIEQLKKTRDETNEQLEELKKIDPQKVTA